MRTLRITLIAIALLGTAPTPLWAKPAARPVAAAHDRFIVLEGGRNFRDLGGYRTTDGRMVRWGAVYRSGSLGRLTPAGQARLESLRPVAIVDLRATEERRTDTNLRLATSNPSYWSREYSLGDAKFATMMQHPAAGSAAASRAEMLAAYRRMPAEQAPSYRELFARLGAGKGTVVFNCTAGKDRTGIGSALVLTALGVPYATVRRDYLLTNGAPGMASLSSQIAPGAGADAMRPFLRAEPEYLDTAFAQIRKDYGSVNGYFAKELGVGPAEIRKLRAALLR